MKEKIKNLSNKKIVITSLCVFAIILLLGLTYAIWSRTFSQTGENISTYDCFEISFSENVNGITMENGYPISDEEGLKTEAYEVTITNTCKIAASYNVVLNKLNASTLNDKHVKIAVNGDIKLLSETETTTTNIENASGAKIINTGVLAGGQTRIIKVQNWMDEATTKEEGTNKTFAYKITIDAVAEKNKLLASNILNESLQEQIPDFTRGFPLSENDEGNGLYKTEDDDGESYYFRGAIKNNYVQLSSYTKDLNVYEMYRNGESTPFDIYYDYGLVTEACNNYHDVDYGYSTASECLENVISKKIANAGDPITWRIVRVNGNGTIRLVTEEIIGQSAFNNECYEDKYVGYTYDNDHLCTKTNPCMNNAGTSSTVNNYIEEWYDNNMIKVDAKIALENYCNDTTYTTNNNDKYYNAINRVNAGKPNLKCPDTTVNYGGNYKLKVGLLTADEINLSGFSWDTPYAISTNYLFKSEIDFWLFSPSGNSDTRSNDFVAISREGNMNDSDVNMTFIGIRPVINLKSDVKVVSGNGTKKNPYVIE